MNVAQPVDAMRTPRLDRRAVSAVILGNALEFYDFTTYSFFAVFIGNAYFPAGDDVTSLLYSVATFGIGFLTRPIGGIIIGAYADRAGRKPAMLLTIALSRSSIGPTGCGISVSRRAITDPSRR